MATIAMITYYSVYKGPDQLRLSIMDGKRGGKDDAM
ncbi:hypothetical protein Tco_0541487, partial [Tanacetum coccineum]